VSAPERVRLATASEPSGEGWWRWSVWIEGTDAALDLLESVRYVLHQTFRNPVRVVRNRATRFRLDAEGWGEFALLAHVTRRDGATFRLERWLDLGDPSVSATDRRPCVFLSFGAADGRLAFALREDLAKQGVDVVTPQESEPGLSMSSTIREKLQRADLVAFLTGGELRGFAEIELDQARQSEKPFLPVLIGRDTEAPAQLANVEPVRMYTLSDSSVVADAIRARVNDVFHED
jgi:hypothetical protein